MYVWVGAGLQSVQSSLMLMDHSLKSAHCLDWKSDKATSALTNWDSISDQQMINSDLLAYHPLISLILLTNHLLRSPLQATIYQDLFYSKLSLYIFSHRASAGRLIKLQAEMKLQHKCSRTMLQRWEVSNYHFGSGVVVLIDRSFVYVVVLWGGFWLFRRLHFVLVGWC